LASYRESLEGDFDVIGQDVRHWATSARAVALGGYFERIRRIVACNGKRSDSVLVGLVAHTLDYKDYP
jgi:hypothetical protein